MWGLRQNSIKYNNTERTTLSLHHLTKVGGKKEDDCLINLQDFLHLNTFEHGIIIVQLHKIPTGAWHPYFGCPFLFSPWIHFIPWRWLPYP